MRFEWVIGLRFLKAGRGKPFISLCALISVAGVALGVLALVVVIAVMNGFSSELEEKLVGSVSHASVTAIDGKIRGYRQVAQEIGGLPHVVAASPNLGGQALLRSDAGTSGALVTGVIPEFEEKVTQIRSALVRGSLDLGPRVETAERGARKRAVRSRGHEAEEVVWGIVLGKELARKLACPVGSRVTALTAVEEAGSRELKPRTVEYEVRGLFASGLYEYDSLLAYISLASAQELFGVPDAANRIAVRVDDFSRATAVARDIEKLLGPDYVARSWAEDHQSLFAAIRLEKMVMFIILVLIVAVAAANIVSTLIMVVIEKTRQIGVLKAIGATRAQIRAVFVLGGLFVGLLGTALGLAAGAGMCLLLGRYQLISLPATVYLIDHLPVEMRVPDMVAVAVSALVLSLAATVYPAHRASRLEPVEALRYE